VVAVSFVALLYAGIVWWSNSEQVLRLYPALINLGALGLFAWSLHRPPSMVERFARLHHPDLPPEGVRYTVNVTRVWCGFFILNGAIATYTAVFSSRAVWTLYNGLIAYVLMGVLFAGEWWVRRRVMPPAAAV
jgi:uncharacterized membrane protein